MMRSILVVCLGMLLFVLGGPQAAELKKDTPAPAAKRPVADQPINPAVGPPQAPPRGQGLLPPAAPPRGVLRPPAGAGPGGGPLMPAGMGPPNGLPGAFPPNGVGGPPMMPPNGAGGGPPRWAFPNMPKARAELPKELVPALLASLKDQDKSVRQYAASALVRIGKEVVDPLLELLKGKDPAQRANAAYILGHLGALAQEQAMPLLLKALKDDNRDVRVRAAFAIDRLVADTQNANPMMGSAMAMPWNPGARTAQQVKVALPSDPGTVAPSVLLEKKGGSKKNDKDQ